MSESVVVDKLKVFLFYTILGSYRAVQRIEPLRQRVLPPLKRANGWLARRDRRAGRYDLRNYPTEVTIETTWRCNLTCPMCFREQMHPDHLAYLNDKYMPLDDFRRIAEEILPFAKTINLSVAGEPLLTPHLDEILEILNRHRCKLAAIA